MKANMISMVLLASVLAVACDSSDSTSSVSGSRTVSDCRDAVDRAVKNAGPDESVMMRARDKALNDCMAGNTII